MWSGNKQIHILWDRKIKTKIFISDQCGFPDSKSKCVPAIGITQKIPWSFARCNYLKYYDCIPLWLFRKKNTWNKHSKHHLFQFKWNTKHSIPESNFKVHQTLSQLFPLFQLFHSLWDGRWNTLPALPIHKNCYIPFTIPLLQLFLFLKIVKRNAV